MIGCRVLGHCSDQTQVALGLITNTAFTDFRSGAASAAAVLLFIVILAIAVIRQLLERHHERTA